MNVEYTLEYSKLKVQAYSRKEINVNENNIGYG